MPADAPVEGCSDLGPFVGAQNVAVDVDLTTTESDLPPGEVGLSYASLALVVGGLPPYTISVTGNEVPDGLSLDLTTGILSGMPATAGEFSFTIDAEDAATDTVQGTFDIHIVPAVAIDTAALPVAVVGECYSATVTVAGGLGPYTWTDITEALPGWASTTDSSDVGGCPNPGDEGVTAITFMVTDSLGGTSSKTLDLRVGGAQTATVTPTTESAPSATPTQTPNPTETATASPTATPTGPSAICVGSCNGDDSVAINELITLVNIALEALSPSACAEGIPGGATVNIALLVRAVGNALNGCTAA